MDVKMLLSDTAYEGLVEDLASSSISSTISSESESTKQTPEKNNEKPSSIMLLLNMPEAEGLCELIREESGSSGSTEASLIQEVPLSPERDEQPSQEKTEAAQRWLSSEKIVEVSRKDQLKCSCEYCGRFFRLKRDLSHHIRCVHEKSRPYECTMCPSKFSIRPNLTRHIRTVHEKQKPFKCDTCERPFGLKENLDKHVRLVHEKQRPFTCEHCGQSFGIMSTLKRHIHRNHQR